MSLTENRFLYLEEMKERHERFDFPL